MKVLVVCSVKELQQFPPNRDRKIGLWWVKKDDVLTTLSTEAEASRPFDKVIVFNDGDVDFLVKALFMVGLEPVIVSDLGQALRVF